MGFISSAENGQGGSVISYTEGAPATVKFNAKDGVFQHLGADYGNKTMTIHLLKMVRLPELVLYPFNEKEANPVETVVLYFIDCETGELSTGLVKTFSEGSLNKLMNQIAKHSNSEGGGLDFTDFEITMTWKKLPKESKGYYYIDFTFCKDSKDKPCHLYVVDEDEGSLIINDNATPQRLDEDTFERNKTFFVEVCQNGDAIYDYRLAKEIVKSNFKEEMEKHPSHKWRAYRLFVLSELNFFSPEKFQSLIERATPTLETKALQSA